MFTEIAEYLWDTEWDQLQAQGSGVGLVLWSQAAVQLFRQAPGSPSAEANTEQYGA